MYLLAPRASFIDVLINVGGSLLSIPIMDKIELNLLTITLNFLTAGRVLHPDPSILRFKLCLLNQISSIILDISLVNIWFRFISCFKLITGLFMEHFQLLRLLRTGGVIPCLQRTAYPENYAYRFRFFLCTFLSSFINPRMSDFFHNESNILIITSHLLSCMFAVLWLYFLPS